MNNYFLKLIPFISCFLSLGVCFLSFSSCDTEGVKLSRDDRFRIDTTTNRKTVEMAAEIDKLCKDSTPIFRQHFIDSLLIVREQEILKQTSVIAH